MDAGIKFAFHPHAWTLVERQPELDMVMEMTDPKHVYLVLDTGHATLGGIDPVKSCALTTRASPQFTSRTPKPSTAPRAAGAALRRAKTNTRPSTCTSGWAAAASISSRSSRNCGGATTMGG